MVSTEFEKLLKELKLSPEDFGLAIGVGKSSIYKILRGDTKKITKNLAQKINFKFPQYTIEYLVSLNFLGEGVKARDEEEILTAEEIKIVSRVFLLKEKQILDVPFFKKWLKEKELKAKLEVYKDVEKLKNNLRKKEL